MTEQTDGRRARGERRRRAIVEATLRVIERDGVAGVTHRTVAREAEVPTTATTYYFAGLDDLLTATLLWSAERFAEAAAELVRAFAEEAEEAVGATADLIDAVARLLATAVGRDRGRTLAEYELYLFAARRPELRPAARRWIDLLAGLVPHADEVAFRALVVGVDGLLMQALIADQPPTEADFRPVVAFLLAPLRPRSNSQ
ncbi:TetR family transcriptional regulator [Solihabitans fulvus]|uniref:TetR family transcriptional regulator n=1 Tax=Solihabitans fulvus TaxID=1892852 RepID=A0A5B2W917_9PSEU|nr:TetR family transcriptional regulator [Solihabitans fulvus]KAA2248453.1 TetR family transcriptional regulator [Solihabitans fulvus]